MPDKKRGRPKADNPKSHFFKMRMSGNELAKLEEVSHLTGISKTEIMTIGLDYIYKYVKDKHCI